jgi:hypothetical protein
MSFPEWGPPLGSIYVPVGNRKCALMPWGDAVSARWRCMSDLGHRDNTYHLHEKRRAKEEEWDKRLEEDKETFLREFKVRFDRISPGFSQCVAFLRNEVRISMWDVPNNSEALEQILRRLVRGGQVVALIDSGGGSASGVSRWYAPQSWKSGGGGLVGGPGSASSLATSLAAARLVLDSNLARGNSVFGGGTALARSISTNGGDGGSGFGLLDAVEKVAGAAIGGASPSSDDGGGPLLKNFGDDSDGGSLLDAAPFELDAITFDDAQDLAGTFTTPAEQAECMQEWLDAQDICHSIGKAMGGWGTVDACIQRARHNYNVCMGYTRPI